MREFETRATKTPKKKSASAEEEEEPQAIEVLTDVLLALLAKPSALLRAVCEHVFRIYCEQLTSGAMDLILQVREKLLLSWPGSASSAVWCVARDYLCLCRMRAMPGLSRRILTAFDALWSWFLRRFVGAGRGPHQGL